MNLYLLLKLLLIGFVISCLGACHYVKLPFIEADTGSDLKEVRLGKSNYYLLLPDGFELSEARGKEGQLGYNIKPKDAASTSFGFIEIQHGKPIDGDVPSNETGKLFARSNFLNKEVTWTIGKTETGYFNAYTTENGDLNASVSSKDQDEIVRLISIIATLKNGRQSSTDRNPDQAY